MSVWIFQANPATFDIDGYLAATSQIRFTVRQKHFANRISVGDRVYVWRSQGAGGEPGGVIASGWISRSAIEEPDDSTALIFWKDSAANRTELRVAIDVDRVADKKEVVRRDWLKGDPILDSLRILKFFSETNYELTDQQASRLAVLWDNTGRDWDESESMAGLWAYAHTYGGEVSKLPSSPVSEVAIRIGRAISGVYNKVMNFRAIDPRDPRAGFPSVSNADRSVWSSYFNNQTQELDLPQLDADYTSRWVNQRIRATDVSGDESTSIVVADSPSAGKGQGYESDPKIRRAIELHAMTRAMHHYESSGFAVADTSKTKPYDLSCTKDGAEVRVEVKGTQGSAATVEVTIGEVLNARGVDWRTDLFIVSGIIVERTDQPSATGGTVRVVSSWQPTDADLSPIRYRCTVR